MCDELGKTSITAIWKLEQYQYEVISESVVLDEMKDSALLVIEKRRRGGLRRSLGAHRREDAEIRFAAS